METARIIREELRALLNTKAINKKQFTYLLGKSPPRPRYFYLLPKIHKASDKWTVPHRVPPGRPIVSDCGSESYGVAEYLDYYLTPLSVRHKSYIRDTPHFLAKVASLRLREPCFLFTMDVNSLYTNIEIPLGIQAVRDIFDRYPDASRPDEVLLRLLDISLTRNDFVFQDRFYLQIKGTAMGKRFAPAYANIYMAAWEDTVFPTCQLLPAIYLRYLDDIWGVWTHSKAEFEAFVQTLNAHHTSITVEPEIHDTQVNFLDTTTFKGRDFERTNTLDVKLFIKPTDTHALLHRRSFHPRHVFTGILKSQLLRFSRICTQPQDRDDAMKELFAALRTRGYSRSFLRQSRKALHSSRSPPGEEEKIRLPLVVTYSSFAQKQVRALKASFAATLPGTRLARCFRLIAAYRRNPNLLKLLVRAKLPPVPTTLRQPHTLQSVRNSSTNYAYPLPRNIPRTQTNCVYVIQCGKCRKLYVGETRNALNTRRTQHEYVIRKGTKSSSHLVTHFRQHGLGHFFMRPLEHDPHWTVAERRRCEAAWIRRLNTYYPHGLNARKPCTSQARHQSGADAGAAH